MKYLSDTAEIIEQYKRYKPTRYPWETGVLLNGFPSVNENQLGDAIGFYGRRIERLCLLCEQPHCVKRWHREHGVPMLNVVVSDGIPIREVTV